MKPAVNKTYIHYFKLKPNGTKEYLYSVTNKQVRGKYALHEEREHSTKLRISSKVNDHKLNSLKSK